MGAAAAARARKRKKRKIRTLVESGRLVRGKDFRSKNNNKENQITSKVSRPSSLYLFSRTLVVHRDGTFFRRRERTRAGTFLGTVVPKFLDPSVICTDRSCENSYRDREPSQDRRSVGTVGKNHQAHKIIFSLRKRPVRSFFDVVLRFRGDSSFITRTIKSYLQITTTLRGAFLLIHLSLPIFFSVTLAL